MPLFFFLCHIQRTKNSLGALHNSCIVFILCEKKHNLFIYLSPNFYFVCLTSSTTDTDTIVESLNPELNQKSFFLKKKKMKMKKNARNMCGQLWAANKGWCATVRIFGSKWSFWAALCWAKLTVTQTLIINRSPKNKYINWFK